MKKTVILAAFAVILLVTNVLAYNCTNNDELIILKNTQRMNFKNPVYIIDNLTYVPLREFSEKLGIKVDWEEEKKQVKLLVNDKRIDVGDDTEYKDDGVIPDKETALIVGKTILEKYLGRPLEYEAEEGTYYLRAIYHSKDNSWRVEQMCDYKVGGGGGTGPSNPFPVIVLNRNTGEVIYITQGYGLG